MYDTEYWSGERNQLLSLQKEFDEDEDIRTFDRHGEWLQQIKSDEIDEQITCDLEQMRLQERENRAKRKHIKQTHAFQRKGMLVTSGRDIRIHDGVIGRRDIYRYNQEDPLKGAPRVKVYKQENTCVVKPTLRGFGTRFRQQPAATAAELFN